MTQLASFPPRFGRPCILSYHDPRTVSPFYDIDGENEESMLNNLVYSPYCRYFASMSLCVSK